MSIESAKAFIERMKTDEEFAKKVTACKDSDARLALIKGDGYDFTPEEIAELRGKLSDDELDSVAGGHPDGRTCGWRFDCL